VVHGSVYVLQGLPSAPRPTLSGEVSHQPSFDGLRLSSANCELCNLLVVSFNQERKNQELIALKEKQGHPTSIKIRGYGGGNCPDFLEYTSKEWTELEQIHVECGWISNSSPGVRCVFAIYSDDGT
jgi:hypothetical protein